MPPPFSPPAAVLPEPLHLARDSDGNLLPAKRKRGRPRKIRPPIDPSADERKYIKASNKAREHYVEIDLLVRAIENGGAGATVLNQALVELAIEAAAIRYEVALDNQAGREHRVDRKRGRRIDALSKMTSILMGSAKLGLIDASVNSEASERIYSLFVATLQRVAEETLAGDAGRFLDACKAALADWESRVE